MTEHNYPRGIRNNNPGNIRWSDEWKGLVPENQRTDKSCCQFKASAFGIRAMIIILHNYQSKYGLKTMSAIIKRWTPPDENDTQAYIRSVATAASTDADKPTGLTDSRKLFPFSRRLSGMRTVPSLTDLMYLSGSSISSDIRRPHGLSSVRQKLCSPAAAGAYLPGDVDAECP